MNTKLYCCLILVFGLMSLKTKPIDKVLKKTNFVFIPSGNLTLNEQEVSIAAFYMLNHEVTNAEYLYYIQDAYLSKGDTNAAVNALPDTSAWSTKHHLMAPFVQYYFRHPAYASYPVVNLTTSQAKAYCTWLTHAVKRQSKDNINDLEVRLPKKDEWIMAAKGGHQMSPYPWGGPYLRNSKGCYLANFMSISNANITKSDSGGFYIVGGDDFIIPLPSDQNFNLYGPAPSLSYTPNDYGLYNMSGNVAEMIANESIVMGGSWNSGGHDIQVTSQASFKKANPHVGFRPVISYLKRE